MAQQKDNFRFGSGQLIKYIPDSYMERTARPVYAIVFLLVFIVCYEVGTIILNPEILNLSLTGTGNVVSFVWVQSILRYLGFSQRMTWIAAPAAVFIILISLQMVSRCRWSFHLKDLLPMTAECILFAVPLVVLCILMNRPPNPASQPVVSSAAGLIRTSLELLASVSGTLENAADTPAGTELFAEVVKGIGAGIFEELIFRLILILLLMLLLQDLIGLSHTRAIVISILVAAVLFSSHHHVYFVSGQIEFGEPFTLVTFIFRTLAGVYLAMLFAIRGFAVTAGTHIFYNVIVALINARNFA